MPERGQVPNANRPSLEERFHSRLLRNPDNGCLEWQGYVGKNGYGQIGVGRIGNRGLVSLTHRVAWELKHGPIPDGLFVCHHCDNRKCCDTEHLFLGTHLDNMRDMFSKGRRPNRQGVETSNGRLTSEQIEEIRRRYEPPPRRGRGYRGNSAELAEEFGICQGYVTDIVRKRWRKLA